ncbi:MAG: zinc transporter ZupT [Defluviitaleaceae bacterium]|nr:zinc transporter ZupT [Defluviitaleaceae bacterium]
MNDVLFAFLLTLIAGLATGLGGLVVLFSKVTNKKFLSICLSFSAGVMIYISFAEIFLEAFESLEYAYGDEMGYLILTVSFFAGIAIMAVIDRFIPHDEEVEELLESIPKHEQSSLKEKRELKRTGISSTIAVAIHNFPEGLITFMAALHDPAMGIAIAIAIIIHNIPEGIAMAAPIYHATGSKVKAFLVSLIAGLTEPLGALIAWLLLRNIFDDIEGIFGIIFAAVGGIMVFVAIHQLLPTAQKYGKHHLVMKWLFAGMAVMAISLVILEFAF